jgi:signal transduction histidine kinase
MTLGMSLANKCQILFGAAIALIIAAAMLAPWVRAAGLADQSQLEASRRIAGIWPDLATLHVPVSRFQAGGRAEALEQENESPDITVSGILVAYVSAIDFGRLRDERGFASRAISELLDNDALMEHSEVLRGSGHRAYRYAHAERNEDGVLAGVVLVEHDSPRVASQLFVGRLMLLAAGFVVWVLAVALFNVITTRIILSPVRRLKATAERVREGAAGVRAEIDTGDEFEELGDAFNEMLGALEEGQQRLRGINASLDLKVTELSQANEALHEAAHLKGDFLATVSHELRTPLNSIIGFAELLVNIARSEQPGDDGTVRVDPEQFTKRTRYLENILTAGRSLLEMINELLEMARIEAGKVDLHIEPMSVSSACEGLLALIRPQADRAEVKLVLEVPVGSASHKEAPLIQTDPRKFQQIVFNFLSNAVKFTPAGGTVTVRAERLRGDADEQRVRVSVLDTGPGIRPEDQERIFEKFVRLESGHVREHQGTGLGLAICKELAELIQGEIHLDSAPGRGSMFSLIVPLEMNPDEAAVYALRSAGRAMSRPLGQGESRRSLPA